MALLSCSYGLYVLRSHCCSWINKQSKQMNPNVALLALFRFDFFIKFAVSVQINNFWNRIKTWSMKFDQVLYDHPTLPVGVCIFYFAQSGHMSGIQWENEQYKQAFQSMKFYSILTDFHLHTLSLAEVLVWAIMFICVFVRPKFSSVFFIWV